MKDTLFSNCFQLPALLFTQRIWVWNRVISWKQAASSSKYNPMSAIQDGRYLQFQHHRRMWSSRAWDVWSHTYTVAQAWRISARLRCFSKLGIFIPLVWSSLLVVLCPHIVHCGVQRSERNLDKLFKSIISSCKFWLLVIGDVIFGGLLEDNAVNSIP